MNNTEKAIALVTCFTNGDKETAKSLLKDNYIQHNLAYETGKEAFLGSVEYLGNAPVKTTYKNIRAFEDGDKVILHSVYNFAGAGEQVAFDIFRFEDGLIAEHWDNLANIAPANPSGHTQIDGETNIDESYNTEETKTIVANFVGDVLRGENPDKLTSYFDGDSYIQHNITMSNGLSGLGKALEELAKQNIKMEYFKTHMVLGSGNFALAVSEGAFANEKTTYYDLFRVENGKIAEHWDVMEKLIPENEWQNTNGKF